MSSSGPIGVLLAAGRGRRAGGAKQFQPVSTPAGDKPLVAAAFDAIEPVCASMLVVLGHRADEVAALLTGRQFDVVRSDPDAPMFASVRAGLIAAQRCDADASVLLHPADHAAVAAATLAALLAASADDHSRAVLPEFRGQGGHPVVIPPRVAARVVAGDCPAGLRQFWIDHPQLCQRLPVTDATVVRDLDTLPENCAE